MAQTQQEFNQQAQQSGMTPEQFQQYQMGILQQQIAAANAETNKYRAITEGGPDLKYNPIEEVMGPDGKPTGEVRLRKELQANTGQSLVDQLLANQSQEEMMGRDNAAANAQNAMVQNRAAQAMRGGVRQTNQALAQRQSLRDMLMAKQDVSKQAMGARSDIRAKGADLALKASDTDRAMLGSTIEGVNKFNLDKYRANMAVKASKEQADATRASASGGK